MKRPITHVMWWVVSRYANRMRWLADNLWYLKEGMREAKRSKS